MRHARYLGVNETINHRGSLEDSFVSHRLPAVITWSRAPGHVKAIWNSSSRPIALLRQTPIRTSWRESSIAETEGEFNYRMQMQIYFRDYRAVSARWTTSFLPSSRLASPRCHLTLACPPPPTVVPLSWRSLTVPVSRLKPVRIKERDDEHSEIIWVSRWKILCYLFAPPPSLSPRSMFRR